ncbi:MAG: L-glutamate gamma-semialdehyde dehydrogenase [Deltaproteobacteria bacterium]|nr:L-glutamate gamma-semialdehyde dehydrogenase [Deltaproteobacteria bacterium]
MFNGIFHVPKPINEPVRSYAPKSAERASLERELARQRSNPIEVPLLIGGREVRTGDMADIRCPHDRSILLGRYHKASREQTEMAVQAANQARAEWSKMPWDARACVLLRAAELLAGPYRDVVNAATMLGQSKTCHQAEIDSACELIDFWRFNPHYVYRVYEDQPSSIPGVLNYMEHRPLESFVFAITPFNFTSIAGNLPTAPALMGNTVVWKPASTAVLSAYYLAQIWKEAGFPDGVINMICGPGSQLGAPILDHVDLGGVHFTGSTQVFSTIWRAIGSDIRKYRVYPRIVGETGGKDFIFVHASADLEATVTGVLRGAFEYQGQKCSAASRLYVPRSFWPGFKKRLLEELAEVKVGDISDFGNFMGAVIDEAAFRSISSYIEEARQDPNYDILFGGGCDAAKGYFIQPTVIEAKVPNCRLMSEEIFGPVLTAYVYPDEQYEETLQLCDATGPYALTGAIFGTDRAAIVKAQLALTHAAGNFYINDKPTGAVVGQQPFGGSRASGTNDKAGSPLNLLRWVSPRAIKENLAPPKDWRYPFLG